MSKNQATSSMLHVLPDGLRAQIMAIFLEEGQELLDNVERALDRLAANTEQNAAPLWLEIQRALHTLKGSCAAAGATHAQATTHAIEERVQGLTARGTAPSEREVHELFDGLIELRRAVLDLAAAPLATPARLAQGELTAQVSPAEATQPPVDVHTPQARTKAADFVRVRPERIDALDALVGELVLTRLQNRALIDRVTQLRARSETTLSAYRNLEARIRQQSRALPTSGLRGLEGSARALGAELLELGRETHALSRQAPLVNAQAIAVSTSLEDGIRELRMMPLGPFFDEYAPVAREAARDGGKQVKLEIRAEGAEIDRSVLLKLRDALLHLVRNAVVHGVEDPDERKRLGKVPQGCITLEAVCEGTRAILRVRDDGGGIDTQRVLDKARKLGLTSTADASLSPQALLDILTHPGFSVRDRADHWAGRGIGLDIVAHAVDILDGRLSLESVPGQGTTFTIEVPITAATSRGLVVRVGEQRFAFMLNRVERVLRLGWDDLCQLEGRPSVKVGAELLSVVELSKLLAVRGQAESLKVPALVLRHGRQRLVVLVDDVPGAQALVIRPFGRAFADSKLFVGGAIQADGAVVPVVNVDTLFVRAGTQDVTFARPVRPANDNQAQLLVVDDSITMRTMLRNILTAAGYHVVVASDGVQALSCLDGMSHCDGVVTDLQMPNLDGVGLCRAIRARGGSYLPIVMVTSVGDAAERRKALDAGADAYVIKAEFEQAGFLERLGGLLGTPQGRAS